MWACPVEGLVSAGSPLLDQHALGLGGTHGDPHERRRWTPFVTTGAVTVFNRAILLFTTDSEAVRRIHEVCCRLDDIAW